MIGRLARQQSIGGSWQGCLSTSSDSGWFGLVWFGLICEKKENERNFGWAVGCFVLLLLLF